MHDIHVVQVIGSGYTGTDFTIVNTVRNSGETDTLTVDAKGGNDTLDASGMGPGVGATAPFPDLAKIVLIGNDGDDRLIGTPFADTLDGGNGSDTYTGGAGFDTFIDASPVTDTDTLIETNDSDMGLYGNLFIVGTIYADDGTTLYATARRQPHQPGRHDRPGQGDDDRRHRQQPQRADRRGRRGRPELPHRPAGPTATAASPIVENITGIFEIAILTGGNSNNTMVVNDIDGTIYVGGVARAVTPWQGHVVLDNRRNMLSLPRVLRDHDRARQPRARRHRRHRRRLGVDDLVVFGTNQPDNVALNAAGSGDFRVGFVQASVVSKTVITYRRSSASRSSCSAATTPCSRTTPPSSR